MTNPAIALLHAPTETKQLRDLELFGGAGGLALGLGKAGFGPAAIVENDKECQATLQRNSGGQPSRSSEALLRTRTADPLLTMEVLYQLS